MKLFFVILSVFVLVACGSDPAERSAGTPIQSRAIETMNAREAQLLGLDKATTGDEQAWAGPRVYTMDEAQSLAATDGKKILLDVYTVWCGFCRKMAAETYPSQVVRSEVDAYFYTVRLDAESDEQIVFNGESVAMKDLATELGVSSFPTTVFISADGEPIGLQPGFMDATMFSSLLGFVGSDAYRNQTFETYVQNRN